MKKSLILLASMLICPMLAGCSGGGESSDPTTTPTTTTTTTTDPTEPVHVHSYDDLGFCECGDHQEVAGTVALRNGHYSQPELLEAGTKKIFKVFAPHAIKASSTYGFKYGAEDIEYEWFDTELHKVKMGTTGDNFVEPSKGTFVYMRLTVDGEPGTKAMSYLKTANKGSTTHTFDDHDHCECGFTDTSAARKINYLNRTIDVNPSSFDMTAEQTYSFKAKLYKDHEYKISSFATYPDKVDVEYYDIEQGKWIATQFDNKGLDNFNQSNARFVAPFTTDYYIHAKATQSITSQLARFDTMAHIYTEYGLDIEDRSYTGLTLTVGTESSEFTLEAGAVAYFKWNFTVPAEVTAWEISGTNMSTSANAVHPEGIWREVDENTEVYYREKVLDGGYGYHSGKPASGTYYIRVVNGSNEQKTGIKIKARFHTPV